MFSDKTHVGGEDGPRSSGTGPWRSEHNGPGGEHLDRQPLRPPGKDMESRPASQAGKSLRRPSLVTWPVRSPVRKGNKETRISQK